MDAKILKAAVSAAIRVTVSTTLIGCGGQMSTDAGGTGAQSAGSPPTSNGQGNATKSTGDQTNVGYPTSEPASGGKPGTPPATAGAAPGGAEAVGGMASLGGVASTAEAGSAGEASTGEPLDSCACKALLESVKEGDVLSSDAQACCEIAFADYLKFPATDEQCSIRQEWFSLPAHDQCCQTLKAWGESACTPWGPPVPPELPFEALSEWEAAA